MNNTQSMQAINLLNRLSSVDPSFYKLVSAKLADIVERRREQSSRRASTDFGWGSTQSEWDFINVLKGVSDLLNEPCGEMPERLFSLADRIALRRPSLKVVFFVQEYSSWASFRSIYEYYFSFEDCAIDCIYVCPEGSLSEKEKDRNIRLFREDGCRVYEMVDYDLSNESPDIAFYLMHCKESDGIPPRFCIDEVSKHVRYTVFIPPCFDIQEGKGLPELFYAHPTYYYAWGVVSYSSRFTSKLKRYSYRDADNIIEIGHPGFDGVKAAMAQGSFRISGWDARIDNRPVLLWNTHFSIEDGDGIGTFFEHRDTVFGFFRENKDKVLLWRPHSRFWSRLAEDSRVGKEGVAALLEEIRRMDNVILDEEEDCRYALAAADALLSDATSFLAKFAITGKPVMCTLKNNGEIVVNEAYLKEIETCSSKESLLSFLDRIGVDDEKSEQRKRYFEDEFGVCDGQNGRRIGEYINDAIRRDCEKFASDCLTKGV
ncbi:hypothetical protein [Raoultibacter timonensis]|uniref:hypothetical protein n=1 Tax=Raoultibacter timonensis TaxID=1907662 RepID=UPI0011AF44C3|nr:hypothetical protein [Raoultibacter timonensis]